MSPVRRFREARFATEELTVYRHGMTPPQVGDIIERDNESVRVLQVRVRPANQDIDRELGARPDLGDFMVALEYEPVSSRLDADKGTVTALVDELLRLSESETADIPDPGDVSPDWYTGWVAGIDSAIEVLRARLDVDKEGEAAHVEYRGQGVANGGNIPDEGRRQRTEAALRANAELDTSMAEEASRVDHKTFGWAWDEAEAACRKRTSNSGIPCGVRLLGPFAMIGRDFTYQAEVWDPDGRRHPEIGLDESPEGALCEFVKELERADKEGEG
jgi:hypothetical protein